MKMLLMVLFWVSGMGQVLAAEPFLRGGCAIDWECSQSRCSYGHELGHNGWVDIHQAMHGYRADADFKPKYWLKVFDDLKRVNANYVRIPLMTEGQGILWAPWVNGRNDQITGLDSGFMKNVRFLLDEAGKRGLRVQLGLITGNTFRNDQGQYNFYYAKNLILTDFPTQLDYLKKVVRPFLLAVGSHPALEQFEIMGEADGAYETAKGVVSAEDVRSFIKMNVFFIRKYFPDLKAKLSASLGFGPTPEKVRYLLSGTGVDLYEVHIYNQEGTIGNCLGWRMLDRPVMLGEFGFYKPDAKLDQAALIRRFLRESRTCGFVGAAMWAMDPGYNSGDPTRYNNFYEQNGQAKASVMNAFLSDAEEEQRFKSSGH
jgi:hypothetical protein